MFAIKVVSHRAADDTDGLLYFVDPDLHAMPDVTGLINRHVERELAVGGVRMIAPNVQIDARGASSNTYDP